MSKNIIQKQITYYEARASEYDEWFYRVGRYDRGFDFNQSWFEEVAVVQKALHQAGKFKHILELACGTGIWTQELLKIGEKITAIDASSKSIEINQKKLGASRVEYRTLDLFSWKAEAEYDLVFFSFWLSHVPPDLLDEFLIKVYKSVRSGGQVFLIDSRFEKTSTARNHILCEDGSIYQKRKLNNGQEFEIVKIFYQPDFLQEKLTQVGFSIEVKLTKNYFIYVSGIK